MIGIIVGIVFVLVALVTSIKILRPNREGAVEFLGKYVRMMRPGINLVLPFGLEKVYLVNVTERMADVPEQIVITKDDLNAKVDVVVYYRIVDIKKALYNVDNVNVQIVSLAQTTLRNIIGTMTLSAANSQRNEINTKLEIELSNQVKDWGLVIVRVELQRIEPPREVQKAMNDVVIAERTKNAAKDFAVAKETEADGEKKAAIKRAEGKAKAIELKADAEKTAIDKVQKSLSKSGNYVEWLKVDRWNGVLPQVTGGSSLINIDLDKKMSVKKK